MEKRLLLIWVMTLFALFAGAQKKQLAQARDYIKEGKNLDKAEKMMQTLLKDSANRRQPKIWLTLFDAQTAQYEQGNEKLYLKQNYDTVALFQITSRLFSDMQQFDSIESLPDKKGKVSLKYRERHAEYLNQIRPNLFNGGIYSLNKHDYRQALNYFQQYIGCADAPMFDGYHYATTDTLMPQAAYWAMYACGKLQDAAQSLSYAPMALRDTLHVDYVRQYMAEAYLQQGDTASYVATLTEGFQARPSFPFFFPRLVSYHLQHDDYAAAMQVVDSALQTDSTSQFFRFAKCTVYLNSGQYDDCIALGKQILQDNDTIADVYYNVGLAYFNKAIDLDKVEQKYKVKRQQIMEFYRQSLPYLERYKALAPERTAKWSEPLYTIYLNLNMGKEFDEIDRIRHEYKKRNFK